MGIFASETRTNSYDGSPIPLVDVNLDGKITGVELLVLSSLANKRGVELPEKAHNCPLPVFYGWGPPHLNEVDFVPRCFSPFSRSLTKGVPIHDTAGT
ncbi:MAG: hypothetical protein JOZ08_02585 [Verrucomicrobia bacterium]|nr:hypothetical protein [Verrucomicrobiota bacterium]MBV8279580.1 hypothetical protein [Verrucomicrobiota bacterium]